MLARGVEVLVATPGRLLDHMSCGRTRFETTEVLVLDEADHMLDLGFIVPIKRIVSKLPKRAADAAVLSDHAARDLRPRA